MEQAKKERKNLRKDLRLMVLGIALCLIVGVVGFFAGSRTAQNEQEEFSTVVLQNQMAEMSQLVAVDYLYTNMAKYENTRELYGMTIPFTSTGFILTYDGQIKAGVNMEQVKIALQGQTVTVQVPAAEILAHEIEEDSVQIFDEKNSVFNPFTVKDYTTFYAEQKKEMEKKAMDKGLLKEADVRAKERIKLFLTAAVPEGYTVKVE